MYSKSNPQLWSGRVDEQDGEDGKRWHEKIEFLDYPYEKKRGVTFLGFACDEGVKRNKGRVGAKDGSTELKKAMSGFAWHLKSKLYDCGKIVADEDLEKSQVELALHVESLLKNNHFPIILGGGHEVAFGSFMGAYNYFKEDIAVLNFDAHFDLRKADEATSGTPFSQIASACKEFNYMCLGVSKSANTKALFAEADALHVAYILDTKMTYLYLSEIKKRVDTFLEKKMHLYITIDTDVFPPYQVPAVSAIATRGVDVGIVYEVLHYILKYHTEKVRLIDIAEFSPAYDIHGVGKRMVSGLIFDIVELLDTYKDNR